MITAQGHPAFHQAVARVAGDEAICRQVEGFYEQMAAELARIRPVCRMSGRCCRFREYGHRLFVTTLEFGTFVSQVRQQEGLRLLASRPDGESCRFQDQNLCRSHPMRPMGCRLFFCDPNTDAELQQLYERFHKQLKDLHEQSGTPYFYVEWTAGLEQVADLMIGPSL